MKSEIAISHPPTPLVSEALEVALILASERDRGELADLPHLLEVALFNSDRASRSRLTVTRLGGDALFATDAGDDYGHARGRLATATRASGWTGAASQALARLNYWSERTGDVNVDTVHLLLACIEAGETDAEMGPAMRGVGLTVREALRESLGIRDRVSPQDRQRRLRGPIDAGSRPGRPSATEYSESKAAVRSPGILHFAFRSQASGAFFSDEPVQQYLTKLTMSSLAASAGCWFLWVATIAWSTQHNGWRSLLALAGLLFTTNRLPTLVAVLGSAAPAAVAWQLGGSIVMPIAALCFQAAEIVSDRLGLQAVRAEAAEPRLSVGDARRDARTSRLAGRNITSARVSERFGLQ